jgi:serine/threonine-protein kinase
MIEPYASHSTARQAPGFDVILEEFESAWTRPPPEDPPCWEDYLPAEGEPCTPDLVFWLVQMDIEGRVGTGRPALLDQAYFEHPRLRLPDATLDPRQQAKLVRQEYRLRWQCGQRPRLAEYLDRFPQLAGAGDSLRPSARCPHCGHEEVALADEGSEVVTCPGCRTTFAVGLLFPQQPPQGAPDKRARSTDLPQPATWVAAGRPAPGPLARLGRYEVVEEIARGGMGAIWRVRDPELRRELAVKVLRPELRGQWDMVRRFQEEAVITAQLPHPGIVPVHELGRDEAGLPFLVMKLIRGQTLEELLRKRTSAQEELPRWVAVFEQVCQAVAFAHEHRVIHRDLKPSNVMVGRFGEVQVMDWGLAKVLTAGRPAGAPPHDGAVAAPRSPEQEALTQGMVGTPSYMAPEQANGEAAAVDERADVFSLGGILCAILTGRPPYTGGRGEARRKAAAGELAEALAALDGCGAEVELVALAKACLSVERDGRPRDAAEVARRVAEYRRGVEQRLRAAEQERAAAQARAHEEHKRRRLAVALAVVVLLALGLGASAAAWYQLDRSRRQAESAQRRAQAESGLGEAQTCLRDNRDLRGRDPERWDAAVRLAGAAVARAEAAIAGAEVDPDLADRLKQQRAEVDREGRDSTLRLELDRVRLEKAAFRQGRFDTTRAASRYREALRQYGIDPADAAASARVIGASRLRGELLAGLADWERWTPDAREKKQLEALLGAVEEAGEVTGEAAPLRARWRLAARAHDGAALAALARQVGHGWAAADIVNLARDLRQLGQGGAAVELLRQGRQRFPDDFWLNLELGTALFEVQGSSAEGVPYLMVAAALRPLSSGAHLNLGNALEDKGDVDGAVRCFQRAIDLDPVLAAAHYNLGNALREKGDLDAAIACFRRAIDLDPRDPDAHLNLGNALDARGDAEGAVRCWRQALEVDPHFAKAHTNLGNARLARGDVDGAIHHYQRAIDLDPNLAPAHAALGRVLRGRGDVDGAVRCFRRAIEIDPKLAQAHGALGLALLSRGDFAEAREATRRCLDLLPPHHALRDYVSQQLGQCEAALALDAKLSAVLRGKARPADAAEALALAQLCQQHRKLHVAAASLFADAFAAQPRLAEDPQPQHRYNAACSAALAGCGQGKDADTLDANKRKELRRQALEWLRADLETWSKRLTDAKPAQRQAILQTLRHWQQDSDLAGVRDDKALAALPAAERRAWHKLWADIAGLIAQAQAKR